MQQTTSEVLLGLGANLDDPVAQLVAAVRSLGEAVEIAAISTVYRTEPVGYLSQPDFLNLVLAGRTSLAPVELLDALQRIERGQGRRRTFRDAPRPIDIDLLAYGDEVRDEPELVLPHPRLHERAFVLVPLAEIAPGWRHPRLRRTAAELLASLPRGPRVARWGALPRAG